jgi:hypothetical protein
LRRRIAESVGASAWVGAAGRAGQWLPEADGRGDAVARDAYPAADEGVPGPCPPLAGLTATAYRRDGLGRIIFMHCGPKRHVSPMVDKTDTDSMARIVQVQLRAA